MPVVQFLALARPHCVRLPLSPQVREKESNIDGLITPIEEMYGLLLRYEVRVLKSAHASTLHFEHTAG